MCRESFRASKLLLSLVESKSGGWEKKHGGLIGSKLVILAGMGNGDFLEALRKCALILMHDEEVRVRVASGEVLGALCQVQGPEVFVACRDQIVSSVAVNLERNLPQDVGYSEMFVVQNLIPEDNDEQITCEKITDAAQIFHDTAGWKHLETSMRVEWLGKPANFKGADKGAVIYVGRRCLQSVIEGCGETFNDYITQDLLDLIFQSLNHTNRFVRETGYQLCGSLVSLGRVQEYDSVECIESTIAFEKNAIIQHGEQFAYYLKRGLADNWSQVRLAASLATRQFLQTLPLSAREKFYPKLLPAMCLNRYYVAEGVRIYSQKSWKMVMGMEGKHLVEKYIKETVEFYISQTEADNHAVREAACACIAELGTKVSPDCNRPHVKALLEALIICFKDDSWPVRDAACIACGNFIQCFPEECKPIVDELYPLFFTNLEDKIPSVRQGAALSLANVVKAYGEEAMSIVFTKVKEGLKEVEKQEANTEKYAGLDKGPATFGVVKKLRDNDMDLHTNRQMYSCGSLAPKMGRGGGCMDHMFKRPAEPWEKTDGCIDLVAELSGNAKNQKAVMNVLPAVSKAAEHRHYAHHPYLLETLCRQLPVIAKGIGKKPFKNYLEMFMDAIFYSLTSENNLTSGAATECLTFLAQFLGPSILRGRVEMYDPRYLDLLNQNLPPVSPF